jgi:hypothetical protein
MQLVPGTSTVFVHEMRNMVDTLYCHCIIWVGTAAFRQVLIPKKGLPTAAARVWQGDIIVHVGSSRNPSDLYSGRVLFECTPTVLTGFSNPLTANSGTVPQIRRSIPFTSCQMPYLLAILPFDYIQIGPKVS